MTEFREQLKIYRKSTADPKKKGRPLTLGRMGEVMGYSYGNIHQWENGKNQQPTKNRELILKIIKALVNYQGIISFEEANNLLQLANHDLLESVKDRQIILELLNTFVHNQGIESLFEANKLLTTINQKPLSTAEAGQIRDRWRLKNKNAHRITVQLTDNSTQKDRLEPAVMVHGKEHLLARLDGLLNDSLYSTLVISGRGGLGKTTIANQLAHLQIEKDAFKQVVWVPFYLTDKANKEEVLNGITRTLGEMLAIHPLNQTSADARLGQIRAVLSHSSYFVIVDGVENGDHTDLLIDQIAPLAGESSKILITSRTQPDVTGNPKIYLHPLEEIDFKHSLALLHAQVKELSEEDDPNEKITISMAKKIHASVGGHPLTLLLFPQLLNEFPLDLLLNAVESGKKGGHSWIYARVWESLSADGRKLAWLLCFFRSVGADSRELQDLAGFSADQMFDSLAELRRFSLLQVHRNGTQWIYAIHNLTIQYIQILFKKNQLGANPEAIIGLTLNVLESWFTRIQNDSEPLSWEHVVKLKQALQFSQIISKEPEINQARCRLMLAIFRPLKNHGYLQTMGDFWAFTLQHDVSDESSKCRLLNQLAFIKQKTRAFDEALALHTQALRLAYDMEEAAEIATAHHEMSWCYFRIEDFKKAIRSNQEAIAIFEDKEYELYTDEDYYKALSRKGILKGSIDDLEEAEQTFLKTIELLENEEETKLLIQAYYNFGTFYYHQNQLEKSVAAYSKSKQNLEIFPNRMMKVQIELAQCAIYISQKNFSAAAQIIETIDFGYLMETHSYRLLSSAQTNRVNILMGIKNYTLAEEKLNESLPFWIQNKQSFEVALIKEMVVDLYSEKGDLNTALTLLDQLIQAVNHEQKIPKWENLHRQLLAKKKELQAQLKTEDATNFNEATIG